MNKKRVASNDTEHTAAHHMTPHNLRPTHMEQMQATTDDSRAIGFLERACPVRTAIDVISGRWKPSILELLHVEPRRHSELLYGIAGISSQALSKQLKQLMADDVIAKDSGNPPCYHLTSRGAQLATVMDGLAEWGDAYLDWRAEGQA